MEYEDIVDEIFSVNPEEFLKWEPYDRPEYRDGKLHLTKEQWERISARCPGGRASSFAVWGILVEIHGEDEDSKQGEK